MLFVLDSSLLNLDVECVHQNRALETLLGAFQNRSHLIFSPMDELDALRNRVNDHVSKASRVVLNTLYNRAVEYKAVADFVDYKTVVYIECEERQGIFTKGHTWFVPLRFFSDAGLVQTSVLCENEIDSEFYCLLAELYMRKEKIKGFITTARYRGGSGSGIPKALANYVRSEHSPCLCITDSDRFHPGFKQSSSSRHCDSVARVAKVVKHLTLDERELENLIPVDLLRKVSDVDALLSALEPAIGKNKDLWQFIDIKNGVRLSWIESQDEPTRAYWKGVHDVISRRLKKCSSCVGISDAANECTCAHVPGLGNNVLTNSVKLINSNDTKLNLRLLENDTRWERFGKTVFDFSIASGGEMVAGA